MKIKVIAIVGPTATGKSDFAVQYAKDNNGEIISADSRQVYKGMNIGTGKITKKEMQGIPHYLLDIENPKKHFNVEKFKVLAEKKIIEINNRKKLPIICGGTGFYIDSLLNNILYPNIPHNKRLRKRLEKIPTEGLFNELSKLDKDFTQQLNNSEKNNRQRLIRSIEIAVALGSVPNLIRNQSNYDITWIGLNYPFEKLKERIHIRLIKRMKVGMIKEIENLHKNGLSWKRMEELGLEYRYISRYIRGLLSKEQMLKQLELEICHYAKRQMVWFKRNKNINWIIKN